MLKREFIDQQCSPVRKIKPNIRSVTGVIDGQQFESTLERDLLMIMFWNNDVERLQVQPIAIPYVGSDGKPRQYTPDLLVVFKNSFSSKDCQPPMYCEVKFREELKEDWAELKPKFKAAIKFAKQHGCRFKIFTEIELRTDYLYNVKFLRGYRKSDYYEEYCEPIRQLLKTSGRMNAMAIALKIATTTEERGKVLWTLHCLVSRNEIKFDNEVKITQESDFWI